MSTILTFGFIGLLGFACQWLAWRTKQPAILFLLLVGILVGPVTGTLDADALFGDLLFPFVSLAVAVILFEGSLTLKFTELKGIGSTVWRMVSYGALINCMIITAACHYLIGLDWQLSALFGAIMVVTGPTVIMPILRTVRPNTKISNILRWEGIVIDPLGALFAVLVFEWIVIDLTDGSHAHIAVVFLQTIVIGTVIGAIAAYALGVLLRKKWIPEYLQNFAAIAFVGIAFTLSDTLMHESGLLAVTVMGIWLANMKGVNTRSILEFKESLTLIFVSTLFILLAARLQLDALTSLGFGALALLGVMIFIARPIKVWASTLGSSLKLNEKAMISWLGPRGIVAAAISALFALKLEKLGVEQASILVPLSFSLIIGTVVIQSLTAKPIAGLLGVRQKDANGYLIIGANPVAIAVGKALKKAGIEVTLCDNQWANISDARMAELKTYYGNPISDHADLYLDTSALGGMLGLSHFSEKNTSAALRFKEEFESERIYTLATKEDNHDSDKHKTSTQYKGHVLFDKNTDYAKLVLSINAGAEITQTTLTNEFTFSDWQNHHKNANTALFTITPNKQVIWFTQQTTVEPQAQWELFALSNKLNKSEKQNG